MLFRSGKGYAVYRNLALNSVDETGDSVKQHALSGTARTHDRDVFAGGDRKVRVAQQETVARREPHSKSPDVHRRRTRTISMEAFRGDKATNNPGPINAEYGIDTFCKACHRGTVVIGGREIPQRLKELRGKQQHEQTTG